jgi:hypothetical protein
LESSRCSCSLCSSQRALEPLSRGAGLTHTGMTPEQQPARRPAGGSMAKDGPTKDLVPSKRNSGVRTPPSLTQASGIMHRSASLLTSRIASDRRGSLRPLGEITPINRQWTP